MDGRDVGEKSALEYVEPLEAKLAALSGGGKDYRIGSGGGRMITTMDRYFADWTVVERGWKAHVLGEGRQFASASEAVKTYYAEDPNITDQYLDSFVVAEDGKPVGTIEDGDAVVFFNFRGDRAIEISMAFEQADFTPFERKRVPDVFYAGIMEYDGDAHIPANFLVEPPAIDRTIGQYLCAAGVTSYAIAETQKFGHVTYFWNGNNSGYIDATLEKYEEIPSDKVQFDLRPWMKAAESRRRRCADRRTTGSLSGSITPRRHGSGHTACHCGAHAVRRSIWACAASFPRCARPRASSSPPPTTAMPTACGPRRKASVTPWWRTR